MPHYREVLNLAERLLIEKCRVKGTDLFSPLKLDSSRVETRMREGVAYLQPGQIVLNTSAIDDYFFCLLGSFKEISPAKYESLRQSMEKGGFALDQFLKRLLQNELSQQALEGELGFEGSLLFFFLVQTVKPALEVQAEKWRTGVKEMSWAQGFCPFCGGYPGAGELREEGKRFLHCLLCGTEWEYPRLQCPYCQNQDQDRLTYFQVEGETANRVDICLSCRHYLKTIDSREMDGPLDFEVEDYLTLHLDHLAQEEGYTRPNKLFIDNP
jgi:FdhE protein